MLLFFRIDGKTGSPFHLAGMALAIHAKRRAGQAIENKQLREMAYFALLVISTTYDQRRETACFARRKNPFAFACFSASWRAKTQGSEINGGFGLAWRTLRDSATRKWRRKPLESLKADSGVAPPAPTAGGRIDQANSV